MPRYAMIDENSGFVWGVEDADDPIAACRQMDSGEARFAEYEDIGGQRFNGRSGYHVYVAPPGWDCSDGQDQETIEAVEAMPHVARIATTWTDPTE
jgi:hypothetical protein